MPPMRTFCRCMFAAATSFQGERHAVSVVGRIGQLRVLESTTRPDTQEHPSNGQKTRFAERWRRCSGDNARHLRSSEEHQSELQSLMRLSYAVFCLKKKKSLLRQKKSIILNKNKHVLTQN